MRRLEGRVAIVTGAGRGLGREHALLLASLGARVVVNDLGGDVRGEGHDSTPAQSVAEEIARAGGEAIVSGHDVSDWQQAAEMIKLAVDTFGALHVLVNNAGILRDRTLANMVEDDWDVVVRVHLKGHAAPTRHAMAYWKQCAKDGAPLKASLIHTTSASGFVGNLGQANYAAAKMGVVALSQVARIEGSRFGVRSNAIGPAAATRMAMAPAGDAAATVGSAQQELIHPGNVSPLIAWLAAEGCPANGQLFHVYGNRIMVLRVPEIVADLRASGRWTLEDLDRALPGSLAQPVDLIPFMPNEEDLLRWQAA